MYLLFVAILTNSWAFLLENRDCGSQQSSNNPKKTKKSDGVTIYRGSLSLSLSFFCDCPVLLEFRYCFTGKLVVFRSRGPSQAGQKGCVEFTGSSEGTKGSRLAPCSRKTSGRAPCTAVPRVDVWAKWTKVFGWEWLVALWKNWGVFGVFHFKKLTFFWGVLDVSDIGLGVNYGCFRKLWVPPNHPILIGFSIIFTIHFGGKHPFFLETPICLEVGFWNQISPSWQVVFLSFRSLVRPCGRHDARGRGRPGTSSSGRGASGTVRSRDRLESNCKCNLIIHKTCRRYMDLCDVFFFGVTSELVWCLVYLRFFWHMREDHIIAFGGFLWKTELQSQWSRSEKRPPSLKLTVHLGPKEW